MTPFMSAPAQLVAFKNQVTSAVLWREKGHVSSRALSDLGMTSKKHEEKPCNGHPNQEKNQ